MRWKIRVGLVCVTTYEGGGEGREGEEEEQDMVAIYIQCRECLYQ